MAAIQLDPEAVAADPRLPDRVVLAGREAGIMTRLLLGNALQISPALVIEHAELEELAAGLAAALDACVATTASG